MFSIFPIFFAGVLFRYRTQGGFDPSYFDVRKIMEKPLKIFLNLKTVRKNLNLEYPCSNNKMMIQIPPVNGTENNRFKNGFSINNGISKVKSLIRNSDISPEKINYF